jgi:hypothetical protein
MSPHLSLHLTPEQIVDVILGEIAPQAGAHLVGCAECAAQLEAERHQLAAFKSSAEIASRRSDAYWARQTLLLSCRVAEIDAQRVRPGMGSVTSWAAAAAVVLLAAALVFELKPAVPRSGVLRNGAVVANSANAMSAKSPDPDELLLSRLEQTLDRDGPVALAPAELVSTEMRRYQRAGKKSPRLVIQPKNSLTGRN